MSNAQHTPRPWIWKYDSDSVGIVTAARNSANPRKARYDYTIAKVEDFTPEATKANGQLIAAAPELLHALQDAGSALSRHCDCIGRSGKGKARQCANCRAIANADAAIAKATGKAIS